MAVLTQPEADQLLELEQLLEELVPELEADRSFVGAGRGNRGNIHSIIGAFGKWASGSQHTCTQKLAGKVSGDLNAL